MGKQGLKRIVNEFSKEIGGKGIPVYVVGCVLDKEDNPVLEVVVRRPERYNNPELLEGVSKNLPGHQGSHSLEIKWSSTSSGGSPRTTPHPVS